VRGDSLVIMASPLRAQARRVIMVIWGGIAKLKVRRRDRQVIALGEAKD
jgi:hypothetical protein